MIYTKLLKDGESRTKMAIEKWTKYTKRSGNIYKMALQLRKRWHEKRNASKSSLEIPFLTYQIDKNSKWNLAIFSKTDCVFIFHLLEFTLRLHLQQMPKICTRLFSAASPEHWAEHGDQS